MQGDQAVEKENRRKRIEGTVVKSSGLKTVSVEVKGMKRHPIYGKVVKFSNRYLVHDEQGNASVGDKVVIEESRPLSRAKRWRLVEAKKS